jgi:hypothetical protein
MGGIITEVVIFDGRGKDWGIRESRFENRGVKIDVGEKGCWRRRRNLCDNRRGRRTEEMQHGDEAEVEPG